MKFSELSCYSKFKLANDDKPKANRVFKKIYNKFNEYNGFNIKGINNCAVVYSERYGKCYLPNYIESDVKVVKVEE